MNMLKNIANGMRYSYKSLIMVVLFLSALFSAAALQADDNNINAVLLKRFFSIATASIDGVYYPLGNAMARLLNANLEDAVAISESTGGSIANVELLRLGDVALALIQSDILYDAIYGHRSFTGNSFPKLKVLASLYSEVVHVLVSSDSDIFTLEDLRGKRIAIGEKGSGTAINTQMIIDVLGFKSEDYFPNFLTFTKATDALKNGHVDAVFYTGGVPLDGIVNLIRSSRIRLVQFNKDVRDKLVNAFPYWREEIIAAGTYPGQLSDVNTVGLRALLATTDDFDPDMAEKMLEILFGNLDYLTQLSKAAKKISFKDGLKGIENEMLHEGARRFFHSRGLK